MREIEVRFEHILAHLYFPNLYIQFQKDFVHQKLMTQVEIEILRKELNVVAETSYADELTLNVSLEKLQTEKDNLQAEKQAQHSDNEYVIADLQSQLKKVSIANQVENEAAHNSEFLERNHSQNSVRSNTSNRIQSNRFLQPSQQQVYIQMGFQKLPTDYQF